MCLLAGHHTFYRDIKYNDIMYFIFVESGNTGWCCETEWTYYVCYVAETMYITDLAEVKLKKNCKMKRKRSHVRKDHVHKGACLWS